MANTIQVKRSAADAAPNSLAKGELAWVDGVSDSSGGMTNGILYIGDMRGGNTAGTPQVLPIGGIKFFTDNLLNTTFETRNIGRTGINASESTRGLATTEWVTGKLSSATQDIEAAGDTNFSNKTGGDLIMFDGTQWINKALTGHVSVGPTGSVTVSGYQAGSIDLTTDTSSTYVGTIINTPSRPNNIRIEAATNNQGGAVGLSLEDNVSITGNLTVNGATTTVSSETVSVEDGILEQGMAPDVSGTSYSQPTSAITDTGSLSWYNSDAGNTNAAKQSFFGRAIGTGEFTYIPDATETSGIISGTPGDVKFGQVDGTLKAGAQLGISGVGTLTAGIWQGTVIDTEYGGTGYSLSNTDNGIFSINAGDFVLDDKLAIELGGTGLTANAAGDILVGGGAGAAMTTISLPGNGADDHRKVLQLNAAGNALEYSNVIDGGYW